LLHLVGYLHRCTSESLCTTPLLINEILCQVFSVHP